jgi:diguanylate cyclase (GGDEF)-like protein
MLSAQGTEHTKKAIKFSSTGVAMDSVLRILILEDSPNDAELATAKLKRARIACESVRVETRTDFLEQLEKFSPNLIFSDSSLPAFDGLSALAIVRDRRPDIPFIIVSGTIGEGRAVEALKGGAADYVAKSNLARLPAAVIRAIGESEERRRIARLSRVHAVQSAIASAIVRIRDPQELFQAACAIAVKQGRFALAWVGRVTWKPFSLRPVAWSGHDDGYLDQVARRSIDASDDHRGKGASLGRGSGIVVKDIQEDNLFVLKEEALARGYRSMIALPLVMDSRVTAVFKIYAEEVNFFGSEVATILGDMARDMSFALDYKAKEERLSNLAYHDVLTGLPNRRLLNEHLNQELIRARRQKTMVAVVFLDIDNLKTVNDSFGHEAGDRLLREVSARIASCTREGDIVARLGGDEFVMVLPIQSDQDTVSSLIQRVRDSMSQKLRLGNWKLNVSCSIGVAVYPQDGKDGATLLRNADAHMYRAKESRCISISEQAMGA